MNRRDVLKAAAMTPVAALMPRAASAPTKAKMFDPVLLESVIARPGTMMTSDFNLLIGDTIKEKYEGLKAMAITMRHIIHCTAKKSLPKKNRYPDFWMLAGPNLASIFETAADFEPCPAEIYLRDHDGVFQVGTLGAGEPWSTALYKHGGEFPKDVILVGCRPEGFYPPLGGPPEHYGAIKVENFIL